jgi:nucleotide-binding universal stress UspA family protein
MLNKILVATDGSEPANNALEFAAEMAAENNAELLIVSVVYIAPIASYENFSPVYLPNLEVDITEYIENMVKDLVLNTSEQYEGLKVTGLVKHGTPTKGILDAVAEVNPDLIVVGNRGQGGLLSWLLGSTSRNVVNSCTTSVLVVKDKKYCE